MRTLFYRLPRLAILAMLVAVVGGFGAMMLLGRQEDPTLIERFGFVLVTLPGADAERMEALIADPLEASLQELAELNDVESTSRAGVVQVNISMREDLNAGEVDDAWTLIRAQVARAQAQFPDGTSTPTIRRLYVGASTVLVSLTWDSEAEPELAIMSRLALDLQDRFQTLSGTEETEIFGLPTEEVRVVVDPDALAAAGLSVRSASALIAQADAKAPAGQLRSNSNTIGLEVGGEFDSIARIRAVPLVQRPDGSAVRVGDVATVEKGFETPPRVMNFNNGKRAVLVAAYIQPDLRMDRWAETARALVADFEQGVPRGITVETVFDQSDYTNARLGDLARNLVVSAFIVFAVLFLVMGWRAAFVVGSALPLTICLVLILFNLFGHPLHQMSVTGLVISLGLLIDNAIVVVDEIDQKRAAGASRLEAIDQSLSHLFGPLFASTLTTALAFAPIALLPGGAGEFVGMIGVSVIFAITSSFVLSMTVVPAMAGWFDRKRAGESDQIAKRRWWRDGITSDTISDGYRWTVEAVLRFPPLGIAIGVTPALIGFVLAGTLPSQFFPQTERNQFQVQLTLSSDASIQETVEATERATELLFSYPRVTDVNWTLGQGSPRVYYNAFNNVNGLAGYAAGWVTLTNASSTRIIVGEVQKEVRREFPNAQFLALPYEQGPPVPAPIELLVEGDDLAVLDRLGKEIRRVLASTPGVTYTSASLQLGAPTITLRADEAASAIAGDRLTELAADLNAELEGVRAGSILEGVEELPVRVIAPDDRRGGLEDLRSKTIGMGGEGLGTPISALGEMTLDPKTAVISRHNGRRANQIFAFLEPYTLPAPQLAMFQEKLDASDFELPPGYDLIIGGEAEASGDALANLAGVGIPLILIMAGAVTLVFNSFRYALLILSTGFLAVGLAFSGVWLFNLPMGFNAIVGALGLLGIAINGSIVVLSLLKASPAALADDIIAQREVVVDATRHIVATTLTTIGGFVPLLLSGDAFWLPLAAGISGGVAGSALLALYFTPAMFRVMTMRPISRLLGLKRPAPAAGAVPAE